MYMYTFPFHVKIQFLLKSTLPPPSSILFHSQHLHLPTNYISWKTQIEALLYGLDLFKFIDRTHLPPKPTIVDGESTSHTDYPAWLRSLTFLVQL